MIDPSTLTQQDTNFLATLKSQGVSMNDAFSRLEAVKSAQPQPDNTAAAGGIPSGPNQNMSSITVPGGGIISGPNQNMSSTLNPPPAPVPTPSTDTSSSDQTPAPLSLDTAGKDLGDIGNTISTGVQNMQDINANPDLNVLQKGIQDISQGINTGFGTVGGVIKGVSDQIPGNPVASIGDALKVAGQGVGEIPVVGQPIVNATQGVIKGAQDIAQKYPTVAAAANIGLNVLPFAGEISDAARTAGGLVANGVRDAAGVAGDVANGASISDALSAAKDTTAARSAANNIASSVAPVADKSAAVNNVVGRIIQGETSDIPAATKALAEIPTEGVKTAQDLVDRLDNHIDQLTEAKQSRLAQETTPVKYKDLNTSVQVGNTTVGMNWAKRAIQDLTDLYNNTKPDPIGLATVTELGNKLKSTGSGASLLELDQLAGRYGREKSAFSTTTGKPLASSSKQGFESIRSGLKDSIRNMMTDNTTKVLDKSISNAITTKELVSNIAEQANKLQQKLAQPNMVQKLVGTGLKWADTLSGHSLSGALRGAIYSFIPTAEKSMNAIAVQSEMAKNLEKLRQLNSASDTKSFGQGLMSLIRTSTPVVNTVRNSGKKKSATNLSGRRG